MKEEPGRLQWAGDAGARRLLATVRRACDRGEDLPTRLEAGLGAALGMLSRDPGLARLLTVDPYLDGDEDAPAAQQEWIDRFGGLLREAAVADPLALRGPPFLAPFLIGGVRLQIARLVLNGEGSELSRLLPGLREGLLACYFGPGGVVPTAPPEYQDGDMESGGDTGAVRRFPPAGGYGFTGDPENPGRRAS